MRTDVEAIKHISTLMKSPEINIIQEHEAKRAEEVADKEIRDLGLKKNSPDSTTLQIQKTNGKTKIILDHVDNYNKLYDNGTKTQFITYFRNDIGITDDDRNVIPSTREQFESSKLVSKKPGDISEYAKEHGIEVPWRKVISSTPSIITAISIVVVMVVVMILTWDKIKNFNRLK